MRQVEAALRSSAGIVSHAAEKLHCTPVTVRNYLRRHASLRAAREDAVEDNLDLAESKLLENIRAGKEASIFFLLKTKDKHRGFVERVEATGKDGGPIEMKLDIEVVKNARKRNLELIAEIAERLASRAADAAASGGAGADPGAAEPAGGG